MTNGDFNMEEYAGLAETGFESRQLVASVTILSWW